MLVLICGDTHFTGKNPIARIGDIIEAQFDKLEEIVMLSNKYDAPIIHTGDVFNVSIIANSILTQIGATLDILRHPLYFVWGNHDLLYHSLDLWDRTSLGIMWANSNKIKHISEFWKDYKVWWAWNDWGSDIGIQWFGDKPKYLLSHRAVVSESAMKLGKNSWVLDDKEFCMNIDDNIELKKRPFKLIVCGHWHNPYIFNYQGTKVINPGPILRRTVDEWIRPSVLLLNLDTLMYKKIYLKSAKPPEEVLSRTHIEKRVESYTDGVVQFINQLKDLKLKEDKKASFIKKLFSILDQHELPHAVEKNIKGLVSTLIERGVIKL